MRIRLAIWFLLLSGICAFGLGNNGVPPWFGPSAAFDLQETALYSTRKVNPLYAGAALQVTRASDSTTMDIGFVGVELDNSTMLTFCAATNCGVSIWYDQSGTPHNVAQATFSNMPRIVTAGGIVHTMNGHTCLNFPNSAPLAELQATVAFAYTGTNAFTILSVAHPNSGGSGSTPTTNRLLFWDVVSAQWGLDFVGASGTPANSMQAFRRDSGSAFHTAAVVFTANTDGIFAGRLNTADPTPFKGYVNGGTPGTDSSTNVQSLGTNEVGVGLDSSLSANFDGWSCENAVYATELSLTDMNSTAQNMAAYWGPTWTNITQ